MKSSQYNIYITHKNQNYIYNTLTTALVKIPHVIRHKLETNQLDRVEVLNTQRKVLEKFLPSMLNSDEIRDIILGLADKSIPSVMKHFKANYAGQCDMQLVNKIARECQG